MNRTLRDFVNRGRDHSPSPPRSGFAQSATSVVAPAGGFPKSATSAPVADPTAKSVVTPCGANTKAAAPQTSSPAPAEVLAPDFAMGVVRRAAALLATYNPGRTLTQLVPDLVGFHPLNRDGIALNGDRCDSLLGEILGAGCDKDEADRDNVAVRTTGATDPGIAFNIAVCGEDPKLATIGKDWMPMAFSLSHSHLNQGFKNCLHGAASDCEQVIDAKGFLSMALVESADPDYAILC